MLKPKLQYFGHLIGIANSLEKSLMLRKIEGRRRREHQRMAWLDGIINAMDVNLGKLQEIVRDREAGRAIVHGSQRVGHCTTTPDPLNQKLGMCCLCSVSLSCLTLCNPIDCRPPGSSVHGTSQAGVLEWVAISYSRRSSPPRNQTRVFCISCIGRQILYHWCHLGSPYWGWGLAI